jgi:hypothetical protein
MKRRLLLTLPKSELFFIKTSLSSICLVSCKRSPEIAKCLLHNSRPVNVQQWPERDAQARRTGYDGLIVAAYAQRGLIVRIRGAGERLRYPTNLYRQD